jgi:hypothetical protein
LNQESEKHWTLLMPQVLDQFQDQILGQEWHGMGIKTPEVAKNSIEEQHRRHCSIFLNGMVNADQLVINVI